MCDHQLIYELLSIAFIIVYIASYLVHKREDNGKPCDPGQHSSCANGN